MSGTSARKELLDLRARLARLERELDRESSVEAPLPRDRDLLVLVCTVGESRIGFPLEVVAEVAPIAATTALPEAPPWVCGLLDLRGRPIPVLDVAARVDRAGRELALSEQIVVCTVADGHVGLVVSTVVGVEAFPPEAFTDAHESVALAAYVRTTLIDRAGPVLLLSVAQLVSSSEIAAIPTEHPVAAEGTQP